MTSNASDAEALLALQCSMFDAAIASEWPAGLPRRPPPLPKGRAILIGARKILGRDGPIH